MVDVVQKLQRCCNILPMSSRNRCLVIKGPQPCGRCTDALFGSSRGMGRSASSASSQTTCRPLASAELSLKDICSEYIITRVQALSSIFSVTTSVTMSMYARTALRASRLPVSRPAMLRRTFADSKESAKEGTEVLKKGARRDPELIVSFYDIYHARTMS